ncbi:MAG: argJ1, partial [Clostridiales bacterium]|nr:argJ1 [Clostridiales bacterium]
MKTINGGVTAPKGYMAAGAYAGIKKKNKDMAMVMSSAPAKAAGTFTLNLVKAAPVKWNQNLVKNVENGQVFIINSGVANACTGEQGDINTKEMAEYTASKVGLKGENVFSFSTGVIGKQLPMNLIKKGIDILSKELSDTEEAGNLAAEAIMTTDTMPKQIAVEFEIDGKTVTIGGMAKGSGMIHPNMATMLGFITTDINISKNLLQEALSEDVKKTFNMISVDGDTSTNDMVVILANGLAMNTEIVVKDENYKLFCEALNIVTLALSKKIAGDGEGATKLLEVTVKGAKTKEDAIILSKSIITSSLVKTAVFGEDANWGRILCAMGYAGVELDPYKV